MPYEVFAIPEAQLSSCDTGVLAGYNSSLTDEACRLQCAQGRCDQAMSFIAIGRCLESNWIRPCAFEYHEGIRQRFPFCKQSSLLAIECTQDLVPLYQVDELWLTLNSPKDNLFDCQEREYVIGQPHGHCQCLLQTDHSALWRQSLKLIVRYRISKP
eukprot:Protomagalhaensia_wolfi_Nauph_80__276@NODE_1155_length_1694_cov_294_638671_g882_i0_p2_GENE_NODE_1155_length_1694_cov_294_638671_g882_i0NODE_1155_length_1694_cov_294_638671_g882_i0_p2_ORF_typecomplete_len157_score11_61_NODE_1155_length_1694_cov_294_638671_g882_i0152622